MNIGKYSYLPERVIQLFFECIDSDDRREVALEAIDDIAIYDCESPIEYIFIFSYLVTILENRLGFLFLIPQAKIKTNSGKTYYADFLFDSEKLTRKTGMLNLLRKANEPCKIVIECDGHEFHEVTKTQVATRNARDYDLKSNGYDVIRFSGSQIYNEPYKCAEEAITYILRKCGGVVTKYGDL